MEKNLKCLACGSRKLKKWSEAWDFEYFTSDKVYTYYSCLSCESLSIDPVPQHLLSSIYPSHYYSYSEDNSNSFAEKVKQILDRRLFKKILKNIYAPSISVLDIGGGSGWLLDEVKKADSRVAVTQVVDINEAAERAAIAKGHKFFLGSIEHFNPKKKFDLILAFNLIEHIKDPLLFLEKTKTFLNEGGKILIKTPNCKSLDAYMFRNSYWGGLHAPRHWVIFTESSFRDIARKANLRVSSCRYTQGAPFWCVSLLHFLYKNGLIKINKAKPTFKHPIGTLLLILFAFFDFLRIPFSKTSQMVATLEHTKHQ